MRAYQLFLEMEQLQEQQESIIKELENVNNISERKRIEIHLDRICGEWLKIKHCLDRIPEAKEIIDTIRQMKEEQIEISNKLSKVMLPVIRKKYETKLDLILSDIIELKNKLKRI